MTTELADFISQFIITACFIGVILVILTDKINRAIISIVGALIVFFTLVFNTSSSYTAVPSDFITILFGTAPSYVNLHALVLVIGMLFIVQICSSAGVFQFIAFQLIKMAKGNPTRLMIYICFITILVSAVLGNILAILILIPLTVVASRILNIDPRPYIICQGILIPVGEIIFSISSVPSIIITSFAHLGFIEYFLNVGLFCLFLFVITLVYFSFYHRNRLVTPKLRLVAVLMEFNPWNYVPDRNLFYKSSIVFISVIVGFILIPQELVTPDIIALTGGIILALITRLKGSDIVQKLDLELILYLLGIFLITGAMEHVNVIEAIGQGFSGIAGANPFTIILTTLWISALLSGAVDNIPITNVLVPVVAVMVHYDGSANPSPLVKSTYYSLAFGASLGDNLTPLGDTIMTRTVSEQQGVSFSNVQYIRLSFGVAIMHLTALSIYFTFFYYIGIALFSIFIAFLFIGLVIFSRYLTRSFISNKNLLFSRLLGKLKNKKYRIDKKLIFREFLKKFTHLNLIRGWKRRLLRDSMRFLKELL